MLVDVTEVEVRGDTELFLTFADGSRGTVNLRKLVEFTGVFEPLSSPEYFKSVRVNNELGTICWPNGADICPDVLHAEATGTALPQFETSPGTLQIAEDEVDYQSKTDFD